MTLLRIMGWMTLLAVLVTTVGCTRGTLREPLVPGKGTASLHIGETTVDQALKVLGEKDGSARENSSTTTQSSYGETVSTTTTYQQFADVHYDDGVEITFAGESPTSLMTSSEAGVSDQFKLFREKNMGRLWRIEVRTSDASTTVKTDKGLALLDPQSKVKELYGQPAAVLYSQYDGTTLFFTEGLTVTVGRPPGEKKQDGPKVVTQMAVRKPFAADELRDRTYRHGYEYD